MKGNFTGRGQLINRLSSQVGSRELAIELLKKRGHLEKDGRTLTAAGIARDLMTAEERAIDRKSKKTGMPPDTFGYNEESNKAVSNNKFIP